MKRSTMFGALAALAAMTLPLLAADSVPWPWSTKMPPDPALTPLTSVEDVSVTIDKSDPPTVAISVKASAPTPGYTELQLTPRMGDPEDLIFAFDAKGRAPQDMSAQVITPVTIDLKFSGAPIDKVGVVEIYAQSNCKAFSVTDNKAAECSSQSVPQ